MLAPISEYEVLIGKDTEKKPMRLLASLQMLFLLIAITHRIVTSLVKVGADNYERVTRIIFAIRAIFLSLWTETQATAYFRMFSPVHPLLALSQSYHFFLTRFPGAHSRTSPNNRN